MIVTVIDTPRTKLYKLQKWEIMNSIATKFRDDASIDGIILVYSFTDPRRVQTHRELVEILYKFLEKIF